MTSSTGYTFQAQFRYIMQWFHEWSEMQRGDFIPVLAQKFVPSGYVNGLISGVDGLATEDRPPSLFQCRIKLFRDWSASWSAAEKEQLLNQIKSADSTFASKFEEEMQSLSANEEIKISPSPENVDENIRVEALRTIEPEVI